MGSRRCAACLACLFVGAACPIASAQEGVSPPTPLNVPALVVLALDTSGSVRPDGLARARALASDVLAALPEGSQVAVLTFDDQSRLTLPRTADASAIREAVARVAIAGRFTALHDALYDASRYLHEAPPARKAIVLLTDGRDEHSALTLEDGLQIARDEGVPVYAVGVGNVAERVLRRIAKLTGGEYFPAAEATGSIIASRILAAPSPPAPSAEPSPTVSAAPPAPLPQAIPSPQAASGGGVPRGLRILRIPPRALWPGLALAASLGVGLLLLAILKVRRRHRLACPRCGAPRARENAPCPACDVKPAPPPPPGPDTLRLAALPETILGRVPVPEERVERTVALRERHVLRLTDGPGAGQVFALNARIATSLGRSPSNDIVLDDTAVSAQHCRIRPENGGFVVHDLESTNGTFVNERRIRKHLLVEGDVIRLGETSLQFRTEQMRP